MSIVYPGASYRQLSGKSRTLLVPQVITVHTMVGTLGGTESWFSGARRPYSHLGTGGDGSVRQWQDLTYRAASDLDGNPYTISIENEDRGPLFPAWSGSNVPRFTDAQADALVMLLSWLCHRFGLPRAAIRTSCPHERGIGWHRLGIDPYRDKSCGRRWSSAYGKVCPGDRRIAQLVDEIIPRVSSPAPAPAPEPEDDMPKPFLCRLSLKSPAVLYVDASRHVHWVRSGAALKGYQLQTNLDRPDDGGKGGDVCVLSPKSADPNIVALYEMVVNLPVYGKLPDDHAEVWKGPRLATGEAAVDVDEDALAALVAPLISAELDERLAKAVADESDRRARERLAQ